VDDGHHVAWTNPEEAHDEETVAGLQGRSHAVAVDRHPP
jgi:hypothetical protein